MKTVLITGSSGTIGQVLAQKLEGYDLLLHDYKGRVPEAVGGDLSTEEGLKECIEGVRARCPSLYAIVHTVGPFFKGTLEETPWAIWTDLWRSNVMSSALLATELKPATFVGFGVAGMEQPARLMPAYLAAKCGLLSLLKSLSLTGIRANMISPGFVAGSHYVGSGPLVSPADIVALVQYLLDTPSIAQQNIDIASGIR